MFAIPLQVAALMRNFQPDYFIAGGWAIDLFLEKETRPHRDIEIAVFRKDQIILHNFLVGWVLKKITGGKQSVWRADPQ